VVLVLLYDALEGQRYLLAAFHDLFPEELVFNPCVLEPHEHRVLLVDSLDFATFDLLEYVGAVLVVVGEGLVLELVVLDVHDLLQVEDVVDTLQHISHELLLELDLDRGVRHQQGVRNGHVDALDLIIVALTCLLACVAAASVLVVGVEEVGLLRRRLARGVAGVEVDVPRVDDPLVVVASVAPLARVHVHHDHVLPTPVLLLVLWNGVVVSVVGAWPPAS